MIRINLLSQKRRSQRKEGSQAWLAAVLVGVLFEIVLFFVFHGMKVEELDAQKRKNREISAQIEQSKVPDSANKALDPAGPMPFVPNNILVIGSDGGPLAQPGGRPRVRRSGAAPAPCRSAHRRRVPARCRRPESDVSTARW